MNRFRVGMFRFLFGPALVVLFGTVARAQSLSSFNITGQFTDVAISTGNNQSFLVALGANPSFSYGGNDYTVTDVIGFWVLSDTVDFAAGNTDFTTLAGDWKEKNNNAGSGAIAGWRAANANVGLTPGESETFNFPTLSPTSAISGYGLHVRVDGTFPGTSGNTGHIRYSPVPEPASFAVLGIGAAAMLRRRRRR